MPKTGDDMCRFCAIVEHAYDNPVTSYGYEAVATGNVTAPESFVTGTGKWGPSGTFGTSGGVVTWSIVGAGVGNSTGYAPFFVGNTVDFSSFITFDYQAVIRQAFDAWAAVANIEFIQITDSGSNLGGATFPNIRIGAGYIDGDGNTLGQAFLPYDSGGTLGQNATHGDMVIDSSEIGFWTASSFLGVLTHEIGHALGLEHTAVSNSLMLPIHSPSISTPQTDDINGLVSLYGVQDFGENLYSMLPAQVDLTILDAPSNLVVMATSASNTITASAAHEKVVGNIGNDVIAAGGGNDTLFGDNETALTYNASAISYGTDTLTKNSSTANNTPGTALDLSSHFSLNANAQIANATTTPHVTVNATGNNNVDYYKLVINNAGAVVTVDIDATTGGLDTFISILNSSFVSLQSNDDSATNLGAGGSTSSRDSYLSYTITTPGTYYLLIENYEPAIISSTHTYTMHVSVAGELVETNDSLRGENGNDIVYGSEGNDTIDGGADNDLMYGGIGNDSFIGGLGRNDYAGGAGADSFAGDATGYDVLWYYGSAVTLDLANGTGSGGEAQSDVFTLINAVIATAGNDYLIGGTGNEYLVGGQGYDIIKSGAGADTVYALSERDDIDGGAGADYLDAGDGYDFLWYFGSGVTADLLSGIGLGNDAQGDTLVGFEAIVGTVSDDALYGNSSDNIFYGGNGSNILSGRDGADTLVGGGGRDDIAGGVGADSLDGSTGFDVVWFYGATGISINLGTMTVTGGEATGDTIAGFEGAVGTEGNDYLYGDANANLLIGGEGSNVLVSYAGLDTLIGGSLRDDFDGGAGNDSINGAGGFDMVWYFGEQVIANLAGGTIAHAIYTDTVANVEGVSGAGFNDSFYGNSSDNLFMADSGNDTMAGAAGSDSFYGGIGDDAFDYYNPLEGGDTIFDWFSGDVIRILGAGFASSGSALVTGAFLASDRLVTGTTATQTYGQFIFNTSTHQLFWDSDGTGVTAAQHLVTLSGVTSLSASEIYVA